MRDELTVAPEPSVNANVTRVPESRSTFQTSESAKTVPRSLIGLDVVDVPGRTVSCETERRASTTISEERLPNEKRKEDEEEEKRVSDMVRTAGLRPSDRSRNATTRANIEQITQSVSTPTFPTKGMSFIESEQKRGAYVWRTDGASMAACARAGLIVLERTSKAT